MHEREPEETNHQLPQDPAAKPPSFLHSLNKGLGRLAMLAVLLGYLVVIAAFLWPQPDRPLSRAEFLPAHAAFMVRTLVFHGGLLLVLGLLVAAIFRWKKTVLVGLPLALFALAPELMPQLSDPPRAVGPTIRVMTVNLLASNRDSDAVLREVLEADADLVVFEEYTPWWRYALTRALENAGYVHTEHAERDHCFGSAVFSRLPMRYSMTPDIALGTWGQSAQLCFEVDIGTRPVTVMGLHLLTPYKVTGAMEARHEMADLLLLLDKLKAENAPVVMLGDFNFTPRSPQAADLRAIGLREVHDLAGSGRGETWRPIGLIGRFPWLPMHLVPGLRLDQIFLSSELTCTSTSVLGSTGSDHRPVIADIGFRE